MILGKTACYEAGKGYLCCWLFGLKIYAAAIVLYFGSTVV